MADELLPEALPLFTSLLSGLEEDNQVLENELRVIEDELDRHGNRKTWEALADLRGRHLLAPDFPHSFGHSGRREALAKLSLQDMLEHYAKNYQPGQVQVVVAANFRHSLNRENVLQLLYQHLQSPMPEVLDYELPKMAARQPVPPGRVLYVKTAGQERSQLEISFNRGRAANQRHELIFDLIRKYFELGLPESRYHVLSKNASLPKLIYDPYGDRESFTFYYGLSSFAFKNRMKLLEQFFEVLGTIRDQGLPTEHVNLASKRILQERTKLMGTSGGAAKCVLQEMSGLSACASVQQLKAALESITQQEIANFIQETFTPERALVLFLTENWEDSLGNPILDSQTQRHFKVISQPEDFRAWGLAFAAKEAPPLRSLAPINALTFQFRELPLPRPNRNLVIQKWPGTESLIAIQEIHSEPKIAVIAELLFPFKARKDVAAMAIFEKLLRRRLAQTTNYLKLQGVELSFKTTNNGLHFYAEGNSLATVAALIWTLEKWTETEFSDREFSLAQREVIDSWLRIDSQLHAANLANHVAAAFYLQIPNGQENIEMLETLTRQDTQRRIIRLLSHSDKQLYIVGDTEPSVTHQLIQALIRLSPYELTAGARSPLFRKAIRPTNSRSSWYPSRDLNAQESLGIARIYPGPFVSNLRQISAFQLLAQAIGQEVHQINRGLHGLGYVHSFEVGVVPRDRAFASLYGQSGFNEREMNLMLRGWDTVLDKIRTRELAPNGFASFLRDRRLNIGTESSILRSRIEFLHWELLARGFVATSNELKDIFSSLTDDEIYQVGDEFLVDPYVETRVSRRPPNFCSELFAGKN